MEEIANFPKMSDEELEALLAFEDEDISDCPELTPEQLAQMQPGRHRPKAKTETKNRSKEKDQTVQLAS
jgi:hypothetical protein